MPGFISDAEMEKLEQAGFAKRSAAPSGGFISESDMAKLETAGHAKNPKAAAAPAPKALSDKEQVMANIKAMNESGDTSNDALFNNLTIGYLPQIKAKVGQVLSGQGIANDANYVKRRDQEIAEMNARAEKYPGAHLEGNVVGLVAPMLLTGGGSAAGEALTLGKSIDKAARTGLIIGSLANPGDTQGVVDPLQIGWDRATNAAIGGVTGGTLAAGAHGVMKGADAIGKLRAKPKANAADIRAAAERLDIEATPGMQYDGHFIQGTESSLDQSPSIGGALMRRRTDNVRAGLNKATDATFQDASVGLSPFESGEAAKNGIMGKVGERLSPLQMSYDEIAQSTAHAEVNPKGTQAVSRNVENIPEAKLTPGSPGANKANQYARWIKNAKTVDDLTRIRSMVGKDVEAANGPERYILGQIYEKATNLRQSALEYAAKNAAATPREGEKIAGGLLQQLKETDTAYRGLMEDLSGFAENAKLGEVRTPKHFTETVDAVKSEQMAEKLFNLGDNRLLVDFKAKFPEEFEILRQAKLAQFAKQAMGPDGKISPQKMATQMGKLNPEARIALLGENANLPVDASTVLKAIPPNVNPSKTSVGESFKTSLNPIFQAKELARYGAYRAATSNAASNVSGALTSAARATSAAAKAPATVLGAAETFGAGVGRFTPATAAASNGELDRDSSKSAQEPPLRGKDKWASDGFDKLVSHGASGLDRDTLLQDPKTKELLIRASDLKPGSKAMDKLLEQIKERSSKETK